MRPLPTCTTQQAGETMPEYAARVLRFLLSTSCTATLTDLQLEQADAAAARAVASTRTTDDPGDQDAQIATIARISEARHVIALALKFRRRLDQEAQAAAQATTAPTGGRQPGRPAPLQPGPTTRPPAGQYADPDPETLAAYGQAVQDATHHAAQLGQSLSVTLKPRPTPGDGIAF